MAETEQAFAVHSRTGQLPKGFDRPRQTSFAALLEVVGALTGAEGPAIGVSTACSSGAKAFGTAKRWLDADLADAVVVGGVDSLCQTTLRGFRSLALVSDEQARPFSSERGGINIGEGAGFALLSREGVGPRLLAVGESADAHHMSSPDPEGRGAALAMRAALASAGVGAGEVDYLNAHGTGTRLNDAMEAAAIRNVLGPSHAAIVSTKAYTGHTLGAAGAVEAVFTLQALRDSWTPASLGAVPVDPSLAIEIATELREGDLRFALSNSFAFGGSNASVLFGAPE
jgi:3-oxoacyl-[acyl-carrier-protein] synthase-1